MHKIQARIATANASRYLQQLCKHWAHKFDVRFTPHAGRVPFSAESVCFMEADADGLMLEIEAPDSAIAGRLSFLVIEHLQRFAFREPFAPPEWREVAAAS